MSQNEAKAKKMLASWGETMRRAVVDGDESNAGVNCFINEFIQDFGVDEQGILLLYYYFGECYQDKKKFRRYLQGVDQINAQKQIDLIISALITYNHARAQGRKKGVFLLQAPISRISARVIIKRNLFSARQRAGVAMQLNAPIKGDCVYFLRCNDLIKIGRSEDAESRIQTLQIGNPYELELVLLIYAKSYASLESNIHDYLKEFRVRGEWFKLPNEVLEYITNRYKNQNVVFIPSKDTEAA